MNTLYLLVAAMLIVVAIATYLVTKPFDAFVYRTWGAGASSLVSICAVIILTTCLIGSLWAFALSFPDDGRHANEPVSTPATSM